LHEHGPVTRRAASGVAFVRVLGPVEEIRVADEEKAGQENPRIRDHESKFQVVKLVGGSTNGMPRSMACSSEQEPNLVNKRLTTSRRFRHQRPEKPYTCESVQSPYKGPLGHGRKQDQLCKTAVRASTNTLRQGLTGLELDQKQHRVCPCHPVCFLFVLTRVVWWALWPRGFRKKSSQSSWGTLESWFGGHRGVRLAPASPSSPPALLLSVVM